MEIRWQIHVPLSVEAQVEAKLLMMATRNLLKPGTWWRHCGAEPRCRNGMQLPYKSGSRERLGESV